MPTPAPRIQPSALDLAFGLSTFLKLPIAVRLGLRSLLEAGVFSFSIEAVDVTTGALWQAMSCCYEENDCIIIQFWAEVEVGEADIDLVQQTAIAIQEFLFTPRVLQKRLLIQALETNESVETC